MTVAIPTSAADLQEFISDSARLQAAVTDAGSFEALISNYVAAFHKQNDDVAQQVKELCAAEMADFLRKHEVEDVDRPNLTPGSGDRLGRGKNIPGAKIDKLFADDIEFLQSTWYRNQHPTAYAKQEQLREIRNSFGSTIPADGGFLIPERLRSSLLSVALESAVVRPRATVIAMDSLRVPFPTIDESSHASSVYGGLIGYWTEEAGALTETDATFGRVVLEAKKLTGYSEVPNELFGDSIISFDSFISTVWPRAIAWFEDVAFMTGSGVGEPLGMLESAAAVSVTRTTANKVKLADIANMFARMLPSSLSSAVWLASPAVIAQLLQLALQNVAGTENVGAPPLFLSGGMVNGAPSLQILGRPVIVSEKVPNLGSAGDLSFVDFGYYLLGDRQAMSMETSAHYKFKNDVTAVRIIERVDGRPWIQSAITPQNGGDTLSPIVKLAA